MDIQSERIVSAAREVLKAHGYFVDNLWHADDVHFLCDQAGLPRLQLPEVMAVFDIANGQFDGEFGICWPQLEKALQAYCQAHGIAPVEKTALAASGSEETTS